jgi:hypothetical protein
MHVCKMYEQFIRRHGRALMGWPNLCATCRLAPAGEASIHLEGEMDGLSDSFATQPPAVHHSHSLAVVVSLSSITFPIATFFAQPSSLICF